nr:myoneurin-like isoform X3 [Danaus plexippus plexippus]
MEAKTTEWRPGPTVCRCCLAEGCYKDISTEYFWMGKREVYAEMLLETFDLNISYSQSGGPNSNSRLICEPCISRLRDAADFKRQVTECERSFTQYLDPVATDVDVDLGLEKEVKIERVKDEKSMSDDEFVAPEFVDDDDDDDDLDDQPLTKLASKIPKKESVDVLDLLDNAKVTEKRKSSSKTKSSPAKKSKLKKEVASSSKVKPEPRKKKDVFIRTNKSITVKNYDGSDIELKLLKHPIDINDLVVENEKSYIKLKSDIKLSERESPQTKPPHQDHGFMSLLKEPLSLDDLIFEDENDSTSVTVSVKLINPKHRYVVKANDTSISQIWEQNALTLFEFSHVYPFIHVCNKYKCLVCSLEFIEAGLLKTHLTSHSTSDLKCELRNKVRDGVIKVDVSCLMCKICQSCPPNLSALKVHLKDHGKSIEPDFQDNIIPFKLGGDLFECQICCEPFSKLRSIIIHMSKHFNNFSCEFCGAVFITLRLLKRHLQTHKSGHYPCMKCDKVFSSANKRIHHSKNVHLKKYPRTCPMCPERFISNYQRTKHLRIVHNKTSGLYRCETCGREYEMKSQLLIHIRSVHMQERNQECSVCLSRFFSKNSLSRHMTIHTGSKNYKCDICGKEYARQKCLKDHLKSHECRMCFVSGKDCGDDASLALHTSAVHLE